MPVEGSLDHVLLGLTLPKLPCCRRLRHCLSSAAPISHFILHHVVPSAHTVPPLECDPHPVGNLIMRPLTTHLSTSASSCYTLFTQRPSILHSWYFLNPAPEQHKISSPCCGLLLTAFVGLPSWVCWSKKARQRQAFLLVLIISSIKHTVSLYLHE